MFTGATLPLKGFSGSFGLEVQRDCAVAFVGKVPTLLDQRVVPCGKPAHIREALAMGGISGVITTAELASQVPETLGLAISDSPRVSAMLLHEALVAIPNFQWEDFPTRVHPTAIVHPSAHIAEQNVVIGEGVVIHPGAIVLARSIIGARSTIGPGTIVGADAFEVNAEVSPRAILKQAGGVRIGTDVDVQSKCTLVRATFGGFTEIGNETKFDCQVHLAHDCRVGKRVQVAACAEISGRVNIGDDSFIGPNVSISNGCNIGPRTHVTIGAVVARDVSEGSRVTGHFAVDHRKWLSFMRGFK
ncbi:hypothetical protein WBP07_17280 [Novosphingobium sp. BL-8A]|uniref:hypothetical protein n=1 Tax=Novosphingobium sp. BL-8A TaxID=3127639 RepID=UPI003757AD8C